MLLLLVLVAETFFFQSLKIFNLVGNSDKDVLLPCLYHMVLLIDWDG
jgi:hypothetical protein